MNKRRTVAITKKKESQHYADVWQPAKCKPCVGVEAIIENKVVHSNNQEKNKDLQICDRCKETIRGEVYQWGNKKLCKNCYDWYDDDWYDDDDDEYFDFPEDPEDWDNV